MDPKDFTGTCKSVISTDTVVVSQNDSDVGHIVHLEGLTGPRRGSRDRPDEPYAFASREYLRPLLVGKPIRVVLTGTASSGAVEFGAVYALTPAGEVDVPFQIVKAGWAKLRDHVTTMANDDTPEGERWQRLISAENEAKKALKGIWNPIAPDLTVRYSPPDGKAAFLNEYKGKKVEAIIEQVFNGSTLRVRLLLSSKEHQLILFMLAGVRAPRATGPKGESPEELGDEAKLFVEQRLLQRKVNVTLLSVSTPPSGPGITSSVHQGQLVDVPTLFIGNVDHPAGNIATFLLSQGLGRVVDWHAGFISLSSPELMGQLRSAENAAKKARRGVWKNAVIADVASGQNGAAKKAPGSFPNEFEAVVTRVWSADSISVIDKSETDTNYSEKRVYLSSVRQIKPATGAFEEKTLQLHTEARELLRKKLIGKLVTVHFDYERPAEGQFEARTCVTVSLKSGQNIATLLIERGYLTAMRHRQGDENKSSDYDALMAAEAKAIEDKRGIHGLSAQSNPKGSTGTEKANKTVNRYVDASENATRANSYLSGLKRAKRFPAIVEFVPAGSRFKLYVPRQQDLRLTLVLSGVRAPRSARNISEKSEPLGHEASAFSYRHFMQRDVEVEVDAVDRSGGFIGRLYYEKKDVALTLLENGLARLDDYSLDSLPKEYLDASNAAQEAKKGLFGLTGDDGSTSVTRGAKAANGASANHNGPLDAAAPTSPVTPRTEYIDIIVSDIRPSATAATPLTFAVQILNKGRIPELEDLMGKLSIYGKTAGANPPTFSPRPGDALLARFSADKNWYRARVRRSNPAKKIVQVTYIDYGNTETLPWSETRPLPSQFSQLPGQAREARLSFVHLLDDERAGEDYAQESFARFRELCEGRQIVANIDYEDVKSKTLFLSLFVPDLIESVSHDDSVNVLLVREGLAVIDRKSFLGAAYPNVVKALESASQEAKSGRLGAYEHGDFLEEGA